MLLREILQKWLVLIISQKYFQPFIFINYLFDKYDTIFSETNYDGCREIRIDFDFNDWAKDFMIKNKDPSIIVYYISHYGRKYIYIADKLKGQYDIMEFKEKEKINE